MSQIEVSYVDHMGSDLSVVNAARVSFARDSNWPVRVHGGELQALNPRDQKLIGYLAKHKHMSPFGHAFASFYVKALRCGVGDPLTRNKAQRVLLI